MARQPPIPADAPEETVHDDPPAAERQPKVHHDPGGGRSSVTQRGQGDAPSDTGAPDRRPT